jgi:hypothetical protein
MGPKFPLSGGIYDYGKVMAIFTGTAFAYMILRDFVSPGKFHKKYDDMMEKVQSNDALDRQQKKERPNDVKLSKCLHLL